ncbi:MAG: hypothetical protein LUF04_00040 [Bacteroides sp.]|nr:hypothetical protein [Bacteroides sp.]
MKETKQNENYELPEVPELNEIPSLDVESLMKVTGGNAALFQCDTSIGCAYNTSPACYTNR